MRSKWIIEIGSRNGSNTWDGPKPIFLKASVVEWIPVSLSAHTAASLLLLLSVVSEKKKKEK